MTALPVLTYVHLLSSVVGHRAPSRRKLIHVCHGFSRAAASIPGYLKYGAHRAVPLHSIEV